MDGELREAPGLGKVSDYLASFGALGATCGDKANVPIDITCNNHLDMIGKHPASLLGNPKLDMPDADLAFP